MKTPVGIKFVALAIGCAVQPLALESAVVFYSTIQGNEAQFDEAMDTAGATLLGRESFPDVGVGQSGVTPSHLIAPGLAAGPLFPSGTSTLLGLLFQTNNQTDDAATMSPGGSFYATGAIFTGDRTWLGTNFESDSIDIIIDPPDHRGQTRGMDFFARTTSNSDLMVRVYDNTNTLVSSFTFAQPDNDLIAIYSDSAPLFRINLHAPTGFVDVADVGLHTVPVPEPALSVVVVSLLGLMVLRRRGKVARTDA